jgi:hypothetical protein
MGMQPHRKSKSICILSQLLGDSETLRAKEIWFYKIIRFWQPKSS